MRAELLDEKLPACELGEGPHWNAATGELSWVDIKGQTIHIYNLESQQHEEIAVSQMIGFAIPRQDHYLAGLIDGLYTISMNGAETLLAPLMQGDNVRFNDGKCDAQGRLWAGTMNMDDSPKETGALYCFHSQILKEVEKGFAIPNGKDWSPDQSTLYHADTTRHVICAYDYDCSKGTVRNKRHFIQFQENLYPDGLCTDHHGNLYVALFGAGEVRIYNSETVEQERIFLPVPNVTSCAFGGHDLKTLFITTAYDGLDQIELKNAPNSGKIFKVSL